MKKQVPIFYSALLLTGVNLLLRLVSTSFQVYLSGRIGAEGIGLLQLVLSVGSMAMVASPDTAMERLLGLGGAVSALCWTATAMLQYRCKKPSLLLYIIPTLFFAAMLVVEFRIWSSDPAILDYCYDLFAMISVMMAMFYLGGFVLRQGSRRMAVFFLLCSEFFCAASMAGSRTRQVLLLAAVMIWCGVNLWKLLRQAKHTEEA